MSEQLEVHIAGLVCAGEGSRLRKPLIEHREVVEVGDGDFRFVKDGKPVDPFEKPLTELVPGISILHIATKDVLQMPTLHTIRFLTNENSNVPEVFGEAIDRNEFLARLGLPPLIGEGISRFVTCEYLEQPAKTENYPYYGTAWAFYLVSQGVELGDNELMMITETDSAYYHPDGISIPNLMVEKLRGNRRGATAALAGATLLDEVSSENGLGMMLLEKDSDELYFRKVLESAGHGNLAAAQASTLHKRRNTTRVLADRLLLEINAEVAKRPPKPENKGERQATDSYNERAEAGDVMAFDSPDGTEWRDSGQYPGLVLLRQDVAGLRNEKNPVWSSAQKAA
jgi:hypothetical protein